MKPEMIVLIAIGAGIVIGLATSAMISLLRYPWISVDDATTEDDEQTSRADDAFLDPMIATMAIGLTHYKSGKITNCIEVLIRPDVVTTDESGRHPGETFVQASLTREEVAKMLDWLHTDWAEHVRANGNSGQVKTGIPA